MNDLYYFSMYLFISLAIALSGVFCILIKQLNDDALVTCFVFLFAPAIFLVELSLFQVSIELHDHQQHFSGMIVFLLNVCLTSSTIGVFFVKRNWVASSIIIIWSIIFVIAGDIFYYYMYDLTRFILFLLSCVVLLFPISLAVGLLRQEWKAIGTFYHGYLRCQDCGRMEKNLLFVRTPCCGCWEKVMARKVYKRFSYKWEVLDESWSEPTTLNHSPLQSFNFIIRRF
jgi:hypothetical protein